MYIGLVSDTHGTFDAPLMKFLQPVDQVDPKLTIYSIVNSLAELSGINKVQLSVNGSTDLVYMETVPLSQVFERNLEIMDNAQ